MFLLEIEGGKIQFSLLITQTPWVALCFSIFTQVLLQTGKFYGGVVKLGTTINLKQYHNKRYYND